MGYLFIAPFFIVFAVFQLIPLASTVYYSFFEYFRSGLKEIGPNFVGLKNYAELFRTDLPKYFGNHAADVDHRLCAADCRVAATGGLVHGHAAAPARPGLFQNGHLHAQPHYGLGLCHAVFRLVSDNGPVNAALVSAGFLEEPFRFLSSVAGTRGLVGLMNFLMWFGNTTILLMAAVMGIDPGLYEAAEIDGCTPGQMFRRITLPLIRPILVYVVITSMIGGLQMFDVPQILTNGKGSPDRCATTMIMYLNNHMYSKNYGMAGAVSTVLFLVCAVLCIAVLKTLNRSKEGGAGK